MTGPDTEIVFRDCTLCEAHCGIQVTVDRKAGRVIDIRGDKEDPLSQGYVCPKSIGMQSLSEDADRLRHPVKRVGEEFIEISWDEAFATVTERLVSIREAHGPHAIATYLGNPNAHDFASNFAVPSLVRALGTRWRFSATSVDQLPKMVANQVLFGSPGTFAVPDVDRTDFLLVLGANPLVSNGSIMTAPDMRGRLRRLRERGGTLVVIDPRRSETAAVADQHLPIRPGTDALLLFAMVHTIFEEDLLSLEHLEGFTNGIDEMRQLSSSFSPESVATATGIDAQAIRKLVRTFAAAERAACYGRIGTCTQEFGTLASWLVDVINVLTGNLDRPGGVMFPAPAHSSGATPRRTGRFPYARWKSRVRGLPEFAGELPVAALAEEIDTPGENSVRALLTVAGNPVCSTPNAERLDRALEQLDFMVSIDLYINETTRHADIILPTSAPLERTNYPLAFHGLSVRNFAKWSPAVLEPPPGVRHLWEIANEIAGRINGGTGAAVEALLKEGICSRIAGPGSANPERSLEEADALLSRQEGPGYLLDALLRSGRYGTGFEDGGLSVQALIDSVHGIDLGPLEPQLPETLDNESGKIELVTDLVRGDIERLRAMLTRRRPPLVLIGRRQLRSNNSWMHNVAPLAKGPERCTLVLHPDDASAHEIKDGCAVQVRSRVGQVTVRAQLSNEMMPGVVSLPHGFGHTRPRSRLRTAATLQPGVNSNALTDEEGLDTLSGNAILNGIPVEIQPLGDS